MIKIKTAKIFLAAIIILAYSLASWAGSADENFHSKSKSDTQARAKIFRPDKSSDEELNTLINESINKFQVKTFSDDITGKSIQYNICFPDDYSTDKKFPVIFFIADASAAGKPSDFSIRQGYGALVWEKYKCVVIVPFYPEVILGDHNGFKVSDYVNLTKRFITHAINHYSIDKSRVYATGQSMGCMTLLLLAANNPDLFTACLFVSGQWDIKELNGLESQKFIYITSAGDDKASAGQREVMDMFRRDNIKFDSFSNVDAKNPDLTLNKSQAHTFITFRQGSTLPALTEGQVQYSEHMSSFDYAYRIQALRDWLFAQGK
ncbi:MAG: prolyl oligopeptidase family serine peptidase [Synergistaceae bacterium]|nr:prolyl oligopeptidase family serine peptidase [Synergistaceae bacterium]